jgi:hypothetical protein
LTNTPEGMIGEWEEPSLHYMDDIDDNLRVTRVPVRLTDKDISHIEIREQLALEYANEYKSKLINKNK